MARVRFQPNPRFQQEQNRDPQTRNAFFLRLETAAEEARARAPKRSGRFHESIRAVLTKDGPRLISSSPYWHWFEFGSVRHRPRAPLRRGVEAAGFRFEDSRGR
jgi:hypothetical protein